MHVFHDGSDKAGGDATDIQALERVRSPVRADISASQCLGCGTYPRRTLAHIVTDSPVAAFIFDSDTPSSSGSISRVKTSGSSLSCV